MKSLLFLLFFSLEPAHAIIDCMCDDLAYQIEMEFMKHSSLRASATEICFKRIMFLEESKLDLMCEEFLTNQCEQGE